MIKGAQHAEADQLEFQSIVALFHRKANNEKGQLKPAKLFNPEKAHKQIDKMAESWRQDGVQEADRQHRINKLRESMRNWNPADYAKSKQKGG